MAVFRTGLCENLSRIAMGGVSLQPLLEGKSLPVRPIYWHYPHYHPGGAKPYTAVRYGDWKLIHTIDGDTWELYNLAQDVSEKQDRSDSDPQVLGELRAMIQDFRRQTDAQMPLENPAYDPARASMTKGQAAAAERKSDQAEMQRRSKPPKSGN